MPEIKAVVFDWAGTMVDFGSRAPMGVFVETFRDFGVEITVSEAREPMGRPKWDHINEICLLPRVRQAWEQKHGRPCTKKDVDRLYDAFVPRNIEVAVDYADLIPGAAQLVSDLRDKGIKIGSTTGYTRNIMERILPIAEKQGYQPDSLVCFGDTAEGRPSPLMMYQSMLELGVWPARSVVKVDDTVVGIQEGLEAGTWTVGVSVSGNLVGLSEQEWLMLNKTEQDELRRRAEDTLRRAGAHYVIDTIASLPKVLASIESIHST